MTGLNICEKFLVIDRSWSKDLKNDTQTKAQEIIGQVGKQTLISWIVYLFKFGYKTKRWSEWVAKSQNQSKIVCFKQA